MLDSLAAVKPRTVVPSVSGTRVLSSVIVKVVDSWVSTTEAMQCSTVAVATLASSTNPESEISTARNVNPTGGVSVDAGAATDSVADEVAVPALFCVVNTTAVVKARNPVS